MAKHLVICEKCSGEIKAKDDLVTALFIYEVLPYHEKCFARDVKEGKSIFLDHYPLNGSSGNLTFIISISLAFILKILTNSIGYSMVALIPVVFRLYSYIVYEVHLKDKVR